MTKDGTDLKLSTYQKWILIYFLKNTTNNARTEALVDNMCLSAIMDFDITKFKHDIQILSDSGLISKNEDQYGNFLGYGSTMEGRLYVKQKIIAPLITARNKNKINEIAHYLQGHPNQQIINEILAALETPDQSNFLLRIANVAINNISSFLDILDKIGKMSGLL